MLSHTTILLTAVSLASATVFVTNPIASTTFSGGKQATINWKDSGSSPSLQEFGLAKVSIYAGNAQQQTLLQEIAPSVDVSTTASIQFTPDPSIGPNSDEYFIRFESLNLKDSAQPQYPALAFSAKFTMDAMTGQFSAAVQAQIDGQSTAPLQSQTSASAASTAGATTTSNKPSTTGSATKTGASASSSSKPNSGVATIVSGLSVWTAVLAPIFGLYILS